MNKTKDVNEKAEHETEKVINNTNIVHKIENKKELNRSTYGGK